MTAEEIVQFAEEVHASMDIERMMECFEPDIVAYWNGRQIASNKSELRAWYQNFFGAQRHFELKKTLRVASPDRLAVEWVHRRTDREGRSFEAFAAEIWYLSPTQRLSEWHAHCTEYPL